MGRIQSIEYRTPNPLSSDKIVEPQRAPLIPGTEAVKKAALEAGAFGCTISGEEKGKAIGERMVEAFRREVGLEAVATVKRLDRVGARLVSGVPT